MRRRAAGAEPEAKGNEPAIDSGAAEERIRRIPVDAIVASPFQPRGFVHDDALRELAASIKENGLLQPIVVRPVDDAFELVTGERRWRACRHLGWATIPAVVRDMSDEEAAALAMIENLQREDLSAVEEAQGYRNLLERFGWTQGELARRLGKSQSTVANKLRLLRLPDSVQDRVVRKALTERHARALLRLPDRDSQERLAAAAEQGGWTVDETERRVEEHVSRGAQSASKRGRKGGRVVRVFKDMRLFRNSILSVVRDMERVGLEVDVEEAVDSDASTESWQIRLSVRRAKE